MYLDGKGRALSTRNERGLSRNSVGHPVVMPAFFMELVKSRDARAHLKNGH